MATPCKLYHNSQLDPNTGEPLEGVEGVSLDDVEGIRKFAFEYNIDPDELLADIGVSKEVGNEKNRRVLERYVESGGADVDVKEGLLRRGIGYKVRGENVTKKEARALFDTFLPEGVEAVMDMYQKAEMKGDSKTYLAGLIYNEVYDLKEQAVADGDSKLAEKYSNYLEDLVYDVAERSTEGGQIGQASDAFYKVVNNKNPETFAKIITDQFEKNAQPQLQTPEGRQVINDGHKTIEEILKSPEFKAAVDERVAKELEELAARPEKVAKKKKAINDFFDKAKIKRDKGTLNSDLGFSLLAETYNATIEVLRKLVLAGVNTDLAIKKALEYARNKHKADFDKGLGVGETFDEKGFVEYFKKGLTDVQAKEARRKAAKEVVEENPEWEAKLAERLTNVDPATAKKIAKKSLLEAAERGSLSRTDFRNIYAQALGMPTITQTQYSEIQSAARQIKDADRLLKEYEANPTPENKKAYHKALYNAKKAAQNIQYITQGTGIDNLWQAFIKLSPLNVVSIARNLWGNTVTAAFVRFPEHAIATGIDWTVSKIQQNTRLSDRYSGRRTYSLASQSAYFKSVADNFLIGVKELQTGRLPDDPNATQVYTILKPAKAMVKIYQGMTGKEKMQAKEYIYRSLEASLGINAEAVSRMLNLFDRPFSGATKQMWADMYAKQLGITTEELLADKEKYELENAIIDEESLRAIYANPTKLATMIEKFNRSAHGKQLQKIGSTFSQSFAGKFMRLFLTSNILYTRVPINLVWEATKRKFPKLLIGAGVNKAFEAADMKLTPEQRYLARRESIKYISQGLWAMGRLVIAYQLYNMRYLEDDPDKKEKKELGLRSQYGDLNRLRLDKDGKVSLDLSYFGVEGALLSSDASDFRYLEEQMAKDGRQTTSLDILFPETQIPEDFSLYANYMAKNAASASKDVANIGFFANVGALTDILSGEYDATKYFESVLKVMLSPTMPANFKFFNQSRSDYKFSTQDDTPLKTILNEYKAAYGGEPRAKINIWGEKIPPYPKESSYAAFYLFGLQEKDPNQFGVELYNLTKETNNAGFLPSAPQKSWSYDGYEIKLTPEMYEDWATTLGAKRKDMVNAYMNGALYFDEITNSKELKAIKPTFFSDNTEEKLKRLKKIYETAASTLKKGFENKYQDYFDSEYIKQNRINPLKSTRKTK